MQIVQTTNTKISSAFYTLHLDKQVKFHEHLMGMRSCVSLIFHSCYFDIFPPIHVVKTHMVAQIEHFHTCSRMLFVLKLDKNSFSAPPVF